MIENQDVQLAESEEFKRLNPYQRLWFYVLRCCIEDLKTGNDEDGYARDWIFNDDNPFFETVAAALQIEPDGLRYEVKKMLRKQKLKVVA